MLWDQIIGQNATIEYLKREIEEETLSHAYLFVGPEGVGKRTTAVFFACALSCERDGCGMCNTCLKIQSGVHPDVYYIQPEGNFITIDQVRDVEQQVKLKPVEGKYKVFVIDEAYAMNQEASNAFLKTLEEPPEKVLFILTTTTADELLPTITSRCNLVWFKLVRSKEITKWLVEKYNLGEEKASLIASISNGIFSRALELAESDYKLERREKVLRVTESLAREDPAAILDWAESFATEVEDSLKSVESKQRQELERVGEFASGGTHASYIQRRLKQRHRRELSKERFLGLDEILSFLATWYRDQLVMAETWDETLLINTDKAEKIKKLAEKTSILSARKAMEIVVQARANLISNVNTLLLLEVMLFKLREVSRSA